MKIPFFIGHRVEASELLITTGSILPSPPPGQLRTWLRLWTR